MEASTNNGARFYSKRSGRATSDQTDYFSDHSIVEGPYAE